MSTLRLILLGISVLAPCAQAAQRIEGIAVRLADGVPVYREEHRIEPHAHRIDYRAPDGTPIGENTLAYHCSDSAPDFAQLDLRAAERQAGRWQDGRYVIERGSLSAGTPRRATLESGDGQPLVASSGFDRFLRANWDALLGGESLVFRFAMPSRLGSIELRARHDPSGADGLAWFRIEPEQPLLRVFVDPIRVAYDAERRLAIYRGLSNLSDADGAALEVEIRYTHPATDLQDVTDSDPRAAAPRNPSGSHCTTETT